jgi:hypothetical protein
MVLPTRVMEAAMPVRIRKKLQPSTAAHSRGRARCLNRADRGGKRPDAGSLPDGFGAHGGIRMREIRRGGSATLPPLPTSRTSWDEPPAASVSEGEGKERGARSGA